MIDKVKSKVDRHLPIINEHYENRKEYFEDLCDEEDLADLFEPPSDEAFELLKECKAYFDSINAIMTEKLKLINSYIKRCYETEYNSIKKTFGGRLSLLMKEKDISNVDLATLIGVKESVVCDYLKCRSFPEIAKLKFMAATFNVEIAYLLRETDNTNL